LQAQSRKPPIDVLQLVVPYKGGCFHNLFVALSNVENGEMFAMHKQKKRYQKLVEPVQSFVRLKRVPFRSMMNSNALLANIIVVDCSVIVFFTVGNVHAPSGP
jgi:hypothetical protein